MPSDAHASRRQADIAKLLELQTEFRGFVSITRTAGNPVTSVELEIKVKTARNSRFPEETQVSNAVRIELPARYPLEPPTVKITSPIYNPNVFPSGLICLGELREHWNPTTNLALVVKWVMKILALDPTLVGHGAPANHEAAQWYSAAKHRNSAMFPTVRLDSLRASTHRTIQWRTIK